MSTLSPFESLYAVEQGRTVSLPPELEALYGRLQFPLRPKRPYVIGNFVTTLDGVVSLNVPGRSGGGEISGFNPHDRLVMGLLRAISGAVIVGAGTLRAVPRHLWTAEYAHPPLADVYRLLRTALGMTEPPLNVIVTGRGDIDPGLRVFQSGEVPVLIVTSVQGADQVRKHHLPPSVQIAIVERGGDGRLSARSVLEAVDRTRQSDLILVEGGPQLIGDFFAEQSLNELFLTLAPQLAGQDDSTNRPGLVAGKVFAPDHPVWGRLIGVQRAGSHLFLRYAFDDDQR